MPDLKLTIFVSSPGDVRDERAHTAGIIERLQGEFRNHVRLEPYFWEEEPLQATGDFQSQIVLPSATDIAVFILWARLGTRLPPNVRRTDGTTFVSGTEFEFEDAYNSHRQRGTPDLLVYRKTARALAELDDEEKVRQLLEQKKALDAFCNRWLKNPDDSFKAAFHTFETVAEFERRAETHLRKLIREKVAKLAGGRPDQEILWSESKGSPYRGLEPFEVEQAPVFYGREHAIDEIVSALQNQAAAGCAFVLILGMSGCGKSSVVRAGVLPRLAQAGVAPEVGLMRRCVFRPSDAAGDLFDGLAQALFGETAVPELGAGGYSVHKLADALRDGPRHALGPLGMALHRAGEAAGKQSGLNPPPEPRLILVVDQLEELFTLKRVSERERSGFIDALSALARSGLVWVLATMRSDFYPRCAEIRELDALKKGQGQYDLLPPTFAEVGQMIRLPARDAGLRFEQDPATRQWLDDLLHEAAVKDPESLPLLEFTLEQLYQSRTPDRTLTFSSYRALGGLEGALAQHAEEFFAGLPSLVQAALPAILPALVTVGHGEKDLATSRRVPLVELATSPERRALVEALVRARLLVADRTDDGQAVVGFVHEALLHHWPRVRAFLEADRDFLRARARVAVAAARWRDEAKSPDFLLPAGKLLAEAQDLFAHRREELDGVTIELIETSIRTHARRRRRRTLVWTAVAAAFLAIVTGFTAYSNLQRIRAENNFRHALKATNAMVTEVAKGLAPIAGTKSKTVEQILRSTESTLDSLLLDANDRTPVLEIAAKMRNRFSELYLKSGSTRRADSNAKSAIAIYQKLLAQDPSKADWQSGLAAAYERHGSVLGQQGHSSQAIELFRRSLEIRKRLAQQDPSELEWQSDLAAIQTIIGNVLIMQGDSKQGEAFYKEAFSRRERVALRAPSNNLWQRNLAVAYWRRGDTLAEEENQAGALEAYRHAARIMDQIVQREPENTDWQATRSDILNNLGTALRNLGDAEGAAGAFKDALAVAERHAALDPANIEWLRLVGYGRANLGELIRKDHDLKKGLQEQLDIARRLQTDAEQRVRNDPDDMVWRQRFADLQANTVRQLIGLAELKVSSKQNLDDAIILLRASIDAQKSHEALDPDNHYWAESLSFAYHSLGRALHDEGEVDQSNAADLDAIRTRITFALHRTSLDPADKTWQKKLASLYGELALKQVTFQKLEEGLAAYQQALRIQERVARENPDDTGVINDMAMIKNAIGDVVFIQGNYAKSVEPYQEGVELARGLVEKEPTNSTWLKTLAEAYSDLGKSYRTIGDAGNAQAAFRHVQATWALILTRDLSSIEGWRGRASGFADVSNSVQVSREGYFARSIQRERQIISFLVELYMLYPSTTRVRELAQSCVTYAAGLVPALSAHAFEVRRWLGRTRGIYARLRDEKELIPEENGLLAAVEAALAALPAGALPQPDGGPFPHRQALRSHAKLVRCVAFSPDGTLLATGSDDRTAILHDLATGRVKAALKGHSGEVLCLAFSPDGKTLATGGKDGSVKLWSLDTDRERSSIRETPGSVFALAFSPAGKILAVACEDPNTHQGRIILRDMATGDDQEILKNLPGPAGSLAFSPNGETLAAGIRITSRENRTGEIKLWDFATRSLRATLAVPDWVLAMSFSPDGTILASGDWGKQVALWDPVTGQRPGAVEERESPINSLTFTPDGKLLATGGLGGTVKIWDVANRQELVSLESEDESVFSLAISPDGQRIAAAGGDPVLPDQPGVVTLWSKSPTAAATSAATR